MKYITKTVDVHFDELHAVQMQASSDLLAQLKSIKIS